MNPVNEPLEKGKASFHEGAVVFLVALVFLAIFIKILFY